MCNEFIRPPRSLAKLHSRFYMMAEITPVKHPNNVHTVCICEKWYSFGSLTANLMDICISWLTLGWKEASQCEIGVGWTSAPRVASVLRLISLTMDKFRRSDKQSRGAASIIDQAPHRHKWATWRSHDTHQRSKSINTQETQHNTDHVLILYNSQWALLQWRS